MTVVNVETGELVEFDRAAAERRAERITLRLDAIADNYRAVLPMIREAIEKRDDIALGYRSPGDYVSDRFGQSLAGLGIEVRRAVVGELTEAGLSTRAIAPVVGVDPKTIRNDLRSGGDMSSPEPEPTDVVDADLIDDEPEAHDDEPAPAPAPPPVVGRDGKTYKRPEPKASPRKPLTDSFFRRTHEARKTVESLARLVEDDRFPQNAEKVAASYRNDLLGIRDLLEQVINAMPEQESTT